MANHEKELFALQDRDGNLIAIDQGSGGYPWVPDTMQGIWLSTEAKDMRKYCSHEPGRFQLVKVSFKVEKVTQSEEP